VAKMNSSELDTAEIHAVIEIHGRHLVLKFYSAVIEVPHYLRASFMVFVLPDPVSHLKIMFTCTLSIFLRSTK
jgi:hypothetical protein